MRKILGQCVYTLYWVRESYRFLTSLQTHPRPHRPFRFSYPEGALARETKGSWDMGFFN